MQGVHAGRYEEGDVREHLHEMKTEDRQIGRERDEGLERYR